MILTKTYRDVYFIRKRYENDSEIFFIEFDRDRKEFYYFFIPKGDHSSDRYSREEFKQILAIRKTELWKAVYEGS